MNLSCQWGNGRRHGTGIALVAATGSCSGDEVIEAHDRLTIVPSGGRAALDEAVLIGSDPLSIAAIGLRVALQKDWLREKPR
jgi:hypothetical protein